MYNPDIYQNDRDEKLNQKKFTLTITLTVTRQEKNFHCNNIILISIILNKKMSEDDESKVDINFGMSQKVG